MALQDIATHLAGDGRPAGICAVCHHMSDRGTAWADTLRGLLANRSIRFGDLAKALANDPDEPTIDWQALSRHARGVCSAKEMLR